ncbi:hypothetical protein C0J52_18383 [Blattella germanica]|nr:hypothetical protein C0J52_18383 [Blattella germanica]
MADLDLICNNPKCRKRLTNIAWITSCSHAFCSKDADISFLNNNLDDIECPACQTPLPDKHDIVKAELNPTEKFKSMVLAGLRPEIIMDITNRALTFWQYQIFQEVEYQKSLLKQCNIKLSQLEENYETQINRLKNDLLKERKNKEAKPQPEENATFQRKKYSLGPQVLDDFAPQPDEKLNWNAQNFGKGKYKNKIQIAI